MFLYYIFLIKFVRDSTRGMISMPNTKKNIMSTVKSHDRKLFKIEQKPIFGTPLIDLVKILLKRFTIPQRLLLLSVTWIVGKEPE